MKPDHIAIAVEDFEPIIELLKSFGLEDYHREVVEAQGVEVLFIPGNPRIEYIKPLSDNPIKKYIEKKGNFAFHHLAFTTDDIENDMKRLKEKGYQFTSEAPMPGAEGSKVAFIHPKSTGGILIELVEEKKDEK